MDIPNNAVILFFLILVCQSLKLSFTQDIVPTFDEKHSIHVTPLPNAQNGETSVRGVIKPATNVTVFVDLSLVADATFLILELHSYVKPLVLSSLYNPAEYANGMDIGLYVKLTPKMNLTSLDFSINNPSTLPVNLMVVPMFYKEGDPVPGGCNSKSSVNTAVSLSYDYENNVVQVDAEAASVQDSCSPRLIYEVYEVYTTHSDPDSYFDTILSIITSKNAEYIGFSSVTPIGVPELRSRFAAYPGIGSVYVVIARDNQTNKRSAYVPVANFHCIAGNDDGCQTYTAFAVFLFFLCLGFIIDELNYIIGRDYKIFIRAFFALGTIYVFTAVTLPSYITPWIIGFSVVPVLGVMCCARWIEGTKPVRQLVSIWVEPTVAIAEAHFVLGIILPLLGLLPVSQDWSTMFAIFVGLSTFIFVVTRCSKESVTFVYGCISLIMVVSYASGGILMYIYVDPARILKPQLSGVSFYLPMYLSDQMLLISLPLISTLFVGGRVYLRKKLARDEARVGINAPLLSSQTSYDAV